MRRSDRRQALRPCRRFAVKGEGVSGEGVDREGAILRRGEQIAKAGFDSARSATHAVSVIIFRSPHPPFPPRPPVGQQHNQPAPLLGKHAPRSRC
jgi:hypothetical protein